MSDHCDFNIFNGPGGKFISIDSSRIDECMRCFREQNLAGIHVSSLILYKAQDLEFLKDYTDIVHAVFISDGTGIDVSGLECLDRLEQLTLEDFAKPVRLPLLKGLKQFSGRWSPLIELGSGCKELEQLTLWKYTEKDLRTFPKLPALRLLHLVQASLQTLEGVEYLREPEELILHRCSRLLDLSALARLKGSALKRISLERCKKIVSYEPLGKLSWLNKLNIEYGKDLPNLQFLDGCRELTMFSFYGTKLLTDDLSPLIRLPKLHHVGFPDQRQLKLPKQMVLEHMELVRNRVSSDRPCT